MLARVFLAACALLFTVAPAFAQGAANSLHKGKVGMGLDGFNGSPNYMLKYFVSDALAVQVVAGYNSESREGDVPTGMNKVDGSDLRIGAGAVYHLKFDRVSPYVGGQVLYRSAKESGLFEKVPDARTFLLVGAVLGAEAFLQEQFSIGVQLNLSYDMANKRDVPLQEKSTQFGTSTLMVARFYVN